MLHEERVKFDILKSWALDSYYDGCRDHAIAKGWSHEQIIGYVSYTFENGFERPIEDLMWRVILLVLSGGWLSAWADKSRSEITELLEKHGLENILIGIPQEEAEKFKHDLKILRII